MITMSNITKNHKVGIFAVFIASALMLGTISVSGLDSAFATDSKDKDREYDSKDKDKHDYEGKDREYDSKDKDKHDYKGKDKSKNHESEQEIEMSQAIKQDSQCFTRGISALNCNNVGLNLQFNTGNQALGQQ